MDRYKVPAHKAVGKLTVKGSKFISHIFPVSSEEEAESSYEAIKKRYYDATHNCFAYRIDAQTYRFSDDGEPSGTAGRPILQVLEGSELFEALCVVTRYFGGTKLGTGGLIRAYSEAAKEALKQLKIKEKIRTRIVELKIDYANEQHVFRLLSQFEGKTLQSDYSNGVSVQVELPWSAVESFLNKLKDLTHGQYELIKISGN
ncbi:YigZ family protein [Calditrichota bacterium LG25]